MKDEQLRIEVAPAPNAVGRWTIEHEIAAYRGLMGEEATEHQRQLAVAAKDCTCGKQAKANAAAAEKKERPRKLLGWEHIAGCNSYAKRPMKISARITPEEQESRYTESRADDLRQALADSRAEQTGDES